MYVWIVALLLFLVPLPVSAQVQVNLGINFSAPPPLVVVPEVQSVQYVPSAAENVFFYGGQYWAYSNAGWYYAGGYNGPWVLAAPQFVPQPLLIVPVTYYRRPPPEWRGYHPGIPPRWGNNYGRSWQGHRETFVAPQGQPYHQQPASRPPPPREQAVREQPVHEQPVHEQPAHQQPVHQSPPPVAHEQHAAPAAEHEHPPAEHGGEEGHH
jgi:hypothetical protein